MDMQTPLRTPSTLDMLPRSPSKIHPDLLHLQQRRKAQDEIQGDWKRERLPSYSRANTLPIITQSEPAFHSPLTDRSKSGRYQLLKRRSKSPVDIKPYQARLSDRLKTPDFNALVLKNRPIPQLFDRVDENEEFKTRSIQEWKNQVVKIVPKRPSFAIAMDWKAPPAEWDDRDQYLYSPKPMFYKNKKFVSERDFVVNPEWGSEKKKVSVNSPAYSTCALRYGWCC
ncbi:uncharacterized protein LOC127736053 isoform X1 [Mytilus californianus]|uniref:uncharacterized protein LOC127736053 isoform X1 n=1 Tax=Mytilus californianus TaxID=6549 RepID=UPI002247A203|nr:uncharacterized protein LOC127736053 isoform X1 [Mytilus californianus]